MSVRIIAQHHQPLQHEIVVDIGRGTVFGNPHVLRSDSEDERERVIALFDKDFCKLLRQPSSQQQALLELVNKVKRGEKLVLRCYCHPLKCHGSVIKREIERRLRCE